MRVWSTERDGIYFLLSDEQPKDIGDYFVYLNPTNDDFVLFHNETLGFSEVKVTKLLFYYDRQKRYLSKLMADHIVNKITKFDF